MKRTLAMLVLAAVASVVLALAAIAVAASSPAVRTGTHSRVTDNAAILHGSVDPNGRTTTYYFQWGLTAAYGLQSAAHSAGHGTRSVAVSTTAASLTPGTVYHYRLVATNGAGTTIGADRAFRTAGNPPPTAATGPATQLSKNGATVTAVINPNNQATLYYFQYGPSAAYGAQTIAAVVPAGTAPVTVSTALQGLEARTIFHYRVIALHDNSLPQPGADATFMTLPRHRPVPQIHARTRPLRARHKPFVLTTTGSVHGPSWIPGIYDCRGNVSIRYLLGSRRIGSTLVPLGPDCRFAGQTVFNRLPGHGRLPRPVAITMVARYLGNFYLTPHKTSGQTVKLG